MLSMTEQELIEYRDRLNSVDQYLQERARSGEEPELTRLLELIGNTPASNYLRPQLIAEQNKYFCAAMIYMAFTAWSFAVYIHVNRDHEFNNWLIKSTILIAAILNSAASLAIYYTRRQSIKYYDNIAILSAALLSAFFIISVIHPDLFLSTQNGVLLTTAIIASFAFAGAFTMVWFKNAELALANELIDYKSAPLSAMLPEHAQLLKSIRQRNAADLDYTFRNIGELDENLHRLDGNLKQQTQELSTECKRLLSTVNEGLRQQGQQEDANKVIPFTFKSDADTFFAKTRNMVQPPNETQSLLKNQRGRSHSGFNRL